MQQCRLLPSHCSLSNKREISIKQPSTKNQKKKGLSQLNEDLTASASKVAGREKKTLAPPKLQADFKAWAIASLLILLAIAFIHMKDLSQGSRQFINHDDLDFIQPLLKIDLRDYWFKWLPSRMNYGFPLRDLTFYLDKSLSEYFGLNIFWITHFFYFTVAIVMFGSIIRKNFWTNPYLMFAGIILLYTHPLQIEVIEWLTCRKYLTAAIPIAIGTYLFDRWKETDIRLGKISVIFGLWLASLASYPTAVFWIFWVIGGFYLRHKKSSPKKYAIWALSSVFIAALYLRVVGDSTPEVEYGLAAILSIGERAFNFGYNALGRGFFNIIFPFHISAYYSELSILNLLGLVLLGMFSAGLYQYFRSLKNDTVSMRYFKLGTFWIFGGVSLLVPITNTILSFSDFMLADRHFFLALPFFIIGGCYFIKSLLENKPNLFGKKVFIVNLALILAWTIGSLIIAKQRTPLWRDAFVLMDDCRKNEHAPKCYSQVIRSKGFAKDCPAVQTTINEAALMFKDIKYSGEFRVEIPFFHSSCIAMDENFSPMEKFDKIDKLSAFYGETPEIIFALTLTLLEAGNLDGALKMAANYYMGPLELGPISATEAIKAIYAGQMLKICEISPKPQCFESINRYTNLHPKLKQKPAAIYWGKNITDMMAKRGGLI